MTGKITITFANEGKAVETTQGITLLQLMRKEGIAADAPCSGRGQCGKCLVTTGGGESVLACQFIPEEDMVILTSAKEAASFQSGKKNTAALSKCIKNSSVQYRAAFDIGTTTVAGFMLNASDGSLAAFASCTNPQVSYGADVISRISEAITNQENRLTVCIRNAVNHLLQEMTFAVQASLEDVIELSVVGNTCMHHLFLGISPASLAHAPFEPAVKDALIKDASSLGLKAHPGASVFFPPNISGFIGGDTVACLTSIHMEQLPGWTLLVDIGTNGEIVLGCCDRMYAASAAAGPAFEGAMISCGMRGTRGAISHARFTEGGWQTETIEGAKPVGICGSGLLDLTAELLQSGQMEGNGNLADGNSVLIIPEAESGNGKRIELTQKDIRQFQLAKAAIHAAICLIAEHAQIRLEEISRVMLAGAFGSFLSTRNACVIGLIPPVLSGKIQAIGNAAGEGAMLFLRDPKSRSYARTVSSRIHHLDLSSLPRFQDVFVDSLQFP